VIRWISKREAVALVIAAQRPDTIGCRAAGCSLLSKWARAGLVRTKPGERPRWAKYPRQLYLRSDIERRIRSRACRPPWRAEDDALLGTDYDTTIAARLRLSVDQVQHRRSTLGIGPYRSPRSERRYR